MKQLGEYFIDSLKFAREGRRLAGEVRVGCLQRLADVLADDDGALAWKVRGECDAEGKLFLMIEVSGGANGETSQVSVASELTLPARSVACTANVWVPKDRPW